METAKKNKKDTKSAVDSYLEGRTKIINSALNKYLPPVNTKPTTIHKAMRYSLFSGGKRLRRVLCLAAAEACGGSINNAMPLACAVECIHTYSLIHDDLPAMDNDDYRRGRLTNHKIFGEGIAILAGDALLTIAFEIASKYRPTPRYPTATIIKDIAEAAGSKKLIAGKVCDIQAEGKKVSASHLQYIHECKTAALLQCALRLGGMSANCSPKQLKALTSFGYYIGLAFQVIDDILDVTQTSEALGKTAGKDEKSGKATYPSILGLEKSYKTAEKLTASAFESIEPFKNKGYFLRILAKYLLKRTK